MTQNIYYEAMMFYSGIELRARLRKMPDDEQVRFGKAARSCAGTPRCPDTFKRQVEEARTE